MLDKPGCISLEQLQKIKNTIDKTKQIYSIDFSERFEVPSVEMAAKLIKKVKLER